MAAKTSPEPARPRSGKVHEAQRHTVRVRVPKAPVEALRKRWGCDETAAVIRAVREAAERPTSTMTAMIEEREAAGDRAYERLVEDDIREGRG